MSDATIEDLGIELGVICLCDRVFKNVLNFCRHTEQCEDWKNGDPDLKRVARQMLNLREDAIP